MKNENTSLFGNLFGGRKDQPIESTKPTPVVVTAYSQPHVLQQRMREEKLTHGETVTANISPVRLESDHGRMILYFCPMKNIEVLETITCGDGGNLPSQAILDGLTVPGNLKSGLYTLKNVTITSNGTMQVRATSNTLWETA